MSASLKHEGADTFAVCKPCDWERHENNPKKANELMADHNKTKHKEK